jgi:hypothetical protein
MLKLPNPPSHKEEQDTTAPISDTMFRPRLRIPRVGLARQTPSFQRSMHHVPPLAHDFREGVPGLLSAEGFDIAWTQYMTLMMEKLNALTAGTCVQIHRLSLWVTDDACW